MSSLPDEDARLAALHSYQVLDRPRPAALDDLTRLAASIFDTPMSLVSLIDRDRVWFAGNTGGRDEQAPRDTSFCAYTLRNQQLLVVPDATRDPRFADYPNVTGAPHVRFYAGAPVVDEDGHALGVLCVVDGRPRDISAEQRQTLTTLAGQAAGHFALVRSRLLLAGLGDELSQAGQREEDLVAAISHELRTPVTAIQGYLEMLTDNDELAPYRRLVDPIRRNGERLVRMVDHLLAGTRPGDAALAVHRSPVDLRRVVAAAAAACRPLTQRRAAPVSLVASDAPVVASADFTRLGQAVEHLIRNALLFTPADGAVTVRTSVRQRPTIEVIDTGVGIPDDELPRVFDRFYRGRYAREQALPGVGLGLDIARKIVAAHHGTLTIASDSAGTTARITLAGCR